MKSALLVLALTTPLFAQTNKPAFNDCNASVMTLPAICEWPNHNPPGFQRYIGQIGMKQPDGTIKMVNVTEPLRLSNPNSWRPWNVDAKKHTPFSIGATYSLQTENLGLNPPKRDGPHYVPNNHASDGFTLFAGKQWSDWKGVEARAEVIRFDTLPAIHEISLNGGDNHTYSLTAGPVVRHSFGRVSPYFTPQFGVLYQYRPGGDLGAAAGLDLRLSKHVTLRAADMRYSYSVRFPRKGTDPERGRIAMSSGLEFNF